MYDECFFLYMLLHSVVHVWWFAVVDSVLGSRQSLCQTECELSWWICVCFVSVSSASRSASCISLHKVTAVVLSLVVSFHYR